MANSVRRQRVITQLQNLELYINRGKLSEDQLTIVHSILSGLVNITLDDGAVAREPTGLYRRPPTEDPAHVHQSTIDEIAETYRGQGPEKVDEIRRLAQMVTRRIVNP